MFVMKMYSTLLDERGITVEDALEKKFWVNGAGVVMNLCDMTKEHIENCINFLDDGHYNHSKRNVPVPRFYKGSESLFIDMFNEELNSREGISVVTEEKDYSDGWSNYRAYRIIENEGTGYAVTGFCGSDEFKDPKTRELWQNARMALYSLEEYLKQWEDSPEEDE